MRNRTLPILLALFCSTVHPQENQPVITRIQNRFRQLGNTCLHTLKRHYHDHNKRRAWLFVGAACAGIFTALRWNAFKKLVSRKMKRPQTKEKNKKNDRGGKRVRFVEPSDNTKKGPAESEEDKKYGTFRKNDTARVAKIVEEGYTPLNSDDEASETVLMTNNYETTPPLSMEFDTHENGLYGAAQLQAVLKKSGIHIASDRLIQVIPPADVSALVPVIHEWVKKGLGMETACQTALNQLRSEGWYTIDASSIETTRKEAIRIVENQMTAQNRLQKGNIQEMVEALMDGATVTDPNFLAQLVQEANKLDSPEQKEAFDLVLWQLGTGNNLLSEQIKQVLWKRTIKRLVSTQRSSLPREWVT